jgi:hypothetical protein
MSCCSVLSQPKYEGALVCSGMHLLESLYFKFNFDCEEYANISFQRDTELKKKTLRIKIT